MALNAEQLARLNDLNTRYDVLAAVQPSLTVAEVLERHHLEDQLWTPAEVPHAISRAWRWSDHLMAGPELLWVCWNGPIGNPSDTEMVYVLPLIDDQPPPTSENLATADFEHVANLYMTEQQCREAHERQVAR